MAKILLVEDDTNLSEIYQARMEAEGYTVVSAADGEAALAVAAKEKPDLIISDVMMPKISGFEMLDILRNTAGLKETPVIMLTALGQADDKTRADSLGADRYLVKSQVTLEDIVNAAHALLEDGRDAGDETGAETNAPAESAAPAAPAAPAATNDAPATDNAAPAGGTSTTDATSAAPEPVVQQVAVAEPPADDATSTTSDAPAATPVHDEPAEEPVSAPAPMPTPEPVAVARTPEPVATEPVTPTSEPAEPEQVVGGPGQTITPSSGGAAVNSSAPIDDTDTGVATPAPHETAKPLDGAVIDDHVVSGTIDSLLNKPSSPSAATVGGQRVITPPAEQPHASLDELLAKEAAKESGQAPSKTSGPNNGVDPNSISL